MASEARYLVEGEVLGQVGGGGPPEAVGTYSFKPQTYVFFDRTSDRIKRVESDTRLHAQLTLPIGSWCCAYVETDTTVRVSGAMDTTPVCYLELNRSIEWSLSSGLGLGGVLAEGDTAFDITPTKL